MSFGVDNDGRSYYESKEGRAYISQLSAAAAGYDPRKLFSEDFETHHCDENPWNDSRLNVALLNRENHRGIHAIKNAKS